MIGNERINRCFIEHCVDLHQIFCHLRQKLEEIEQALGMVRGFDPLSRFLRRGQSKLAGDAVEHMPTGTVILTVTVAIRDDKCFASFGHHK